MVERSGAGGHPVPPLTVGTGKLPVARDSTTSTACVSRAPYADQPDEALMTCFGQGDLAAFEEIYRRYERSVFGFCVRLVGDPDPAADAFQEVFLRVIDLRRQYSESGRFRALLFTIARNVCIDHLRRRRVSISLPAAPALASGDVSAERATEARDELDRMLRHLTPGQREIVLLHKYHGFSHEEIAAMTGTTEAAVKQKLYRALLALRRRRARRPEDRASS